MHFLKSGVSYRGPAKLGSGLTATQDANGLTEISAEGGGGGGACAAGIACHGGPQPQLRTVAFGPEALTADADTLAELVPAPGVGKTNFYLGAWVFFKAGANVYHIGGATIHYASLPSFGDAIAETSIFTDDADAFGVFTMESSQPNPDDFENQALMLRAGGDADGDGIMYVTVLYCVIKLSTRTIVGGTSGPSPKFIVKRVTSDELKAMPTTPPVIIPAPAANKINIVTHSWGVFKAGETPYAASAGIQELGYDGIDGHYISYSQLLFTGGGEFCNFVADDDLVSESPVEVIEKAVVLKALYDGGVDLVDGDGELFVICAYFEFDTTFMGVLSGRGSGFRFKAKTLDAEDLNTMTSSDVRPALIDAPCPDHIVMLHAMLSRVIAGANPFDSPGYVTALWDNGAGDYAAYSQPALAAAIDNITLGVFDYANGVALGDVNGQAMCASAAGDLTEIPAGDGSLDWFMWYALFSFGIPTC